MDISQSPSIQALLLPSSFTIPHTFMAMMTTMNQMSSTWVRSHLFSHIAADSWGQSQSDLRSMPATPPPPESNEHSDWRQPGLPPENPTSVIWGNNCSYHIPAHNWSKTQHRHWLLQNCGLPWSIQRNSGVDTWEWLVVTLPTVTCPMAQVDNHCGHWPIKVLNTRRVYWE